MRPPTPHGTGVYENSGLGVRNRRNPHPLVAVGRVAEESAIRRSFAGRIARERTGRLLEIAERWRPDLIVRDEVDFAGAIAAEILDLPHAAVVVMAAGGFLRADVVEEPLAVLRAELGLCGLSGPFSPQFVLRILDICGHLR